MAPDSEGGEVTLPQPVLWLIACLRGSPLWHLPSEPALSSEPGSPVDAEYWSLPTLCISQHQKVLPCITAPPGKGHWAIFRPWPLGPTVSPGLTMTPLFLQPISTPQSLSSQKMAPPLSAPGHFLESPSFTSTSSTKCCQSHVQSMLRTQHFCPTLLHTHHLPRPLPQPPRGHPLPFAQHHLSHSIYDSQSDYLKRQLLPQLEPLNGFLQHKDWTASLGSSPGWSAPLSSGNH